jgi:hypothetical protein
MDLLSWVSWSCIGLLPGSVECEFFEGRQAYIFRSLRFMKRTGNNRRRNNAHVMVSQERSQYQKIRKLILYFLSVPFLGGLFAVMIYFVLLAGVFVLAPTQTRAMLK